MARAQIAVVGAGLVGRRHLELLSRSPRTEAAAIVDPAPGAASLARRLAAPWYRTLEELLSTGHFEGVIIASPNALHLEHALACIDAGIPLLVEKPIATSVADGLRIADAARAQGVPLLVGHHRRHSPLLAAARKVVDGGILGRIVAVDGMTLVAKPPDYFEAAPWRRLPGGGPILINLIHDIDVLRALVGEVVAVQAMARASTRGFPVEESVTATMRFRSGALGSLLLSDAAAAPLSWELTTGEDPAFPLNRDRDCYVIAGTQGSLGIPTLRIAAYEGAPSWLRPFRTSTVTIEPADPLVRQLDHFVDVIKRGAEPMIGGHDAVETLRVTLAIAQAVETGCQVACAPTEVAAPALDSP